MASEHRTMAFGYSMPANDGLVNSTGGGDNGGMSNDADIAVLKYRADQGDKRADTTDAKLDRLTDLVVDLRTEIRTEFARRPTTVGLWGMVATMIAVSLAVIGIVAALLAIPWISNRLFGH